MKTKQKLIFTVFMLFIISVTPFFLKNINFIFASLEVFKNWYPIYGIQLWIIKCILLVISIISLVLIYTTFKQKFNVFLLPTIILVTYFCFAVLFEGHHPFSMINMYSSMNGSVNVFYIDDCNDNLLFLKDISDVGGAELSHYYYNFKLDPNIKESEIGKLMWEELDIDDSGLCLCLQKAPITGQNNFQSNKETLYESCQ